MNLTPQQIEAVNRRVHEVCGRGCWHRELTVDSGDEGTSCYRCGVCGEICDPGPDYWHDTGECIEALDSVDEWWWCVNRNSHRFPYAQIARANKETVDATGVSIRDAIIRAILATVGESVESVIAKLQQP